LIFTEKNLIMYTNGHSQSPYYEDYQRHREIDRDKVDELVIAGFEWKDVAVALCVSDTKLRNWRIASDYVDPLIIPSDEVLDDLVRTFAAEKGTRGERAVGGFLLSLRLRVTRDRLRQSLHRVDGEAVVQRRARAVERVVYSVGGPHHLWHIDGCHKLIPYGLVVHGGIDGFSRAVVYLHCSDNNRADTVLRLFREATQVFGVPSRTRSDHGTENVRVAQFMLEQRGLGRGSMLTGTSMRNQRIERLWRDTTSSVLGFYKREFQDLERRGVDFSNVCVRWIMHHLFLARINADLQAFVHSWNNHGLSSVPGQRTPLQLLMWYQRSAGTLPAVVDEALYGVEGEVDAAAEAAEMGGVGAGAGAHGPANHVEVIPAGCPFAEDALQEYQQRVPPVQLHETRATFWPRILAALGVAEEILSR
jgi:hypothetical protein